jgi:hypothetical protein
LKKILAGRVFHGAEVLKSFLEFVVGKSLEGLEGEVKEYTIATEVFGRSDSYDPRIDSLVRVQATRLRSKLEEYYASEGRNDRVYIDLPKGHYIPAFSYLELDNLEQSASDHGDFEIVHGVEKAPTDLKRAGAGPWRLLAGLCLLLSLVMGILAYRYRTEVKSLRRSSFSQHIDEKFVQEIGPLWGSFLSSGIPILVSYSNPLFRGNPEDGLKYWAPSPSTAQRLRPPFVSEKIDLPNIVDVYTGVGEVKGVSCLGNLLWKSGATFRVERSLLLTYEDLKAQSIIFLGGPSENLLLRHLPQEQDFVYQIEKTAAGSSKVVILNRKPGLHELKSYEATFDGQSQSTVTQDYALISMLKGLEPNCRLLILAGITTFGTQACAEFVTDPDSIKELIHRLGTKREASVASLPSYYQVLLKVKVNGSVPIQTSYVTHHVLD